MFCTCARTVSGEIVSSAAISLVVVPTARSTSTRPHTGSLLLAPKGAFRKVIYEANIATNLLYGLAAYMRDPV